MPISPDKTGNDCDRAFLNVLATSALEEGSVVCCYDDDKSFVSVCPSERIYLPLANRLARWPDAWLLPLFPLFLRILYMGVQQASRSWEQSTGSVRWANLNTWLPLMAAIRRLGYYIILLNFRGWILYVGLNAVEDVIVRPVEPTTCWYHELLRDDQPQCFGRVFDFSDHIVLYYAQILPLSMFEFLHSLEYPYWRHAHGPHSGLSNWFEEMLERAVPLSLSAAMVYLYFITCLGVYKTAVYFHTGVEVLVGFLISQMIHMPLCYIQCAGRLEPVREFLFASSSGIGKYKSLG